MDRNTVHRYHWSGGISWRCSTDTSSFNRNHASSSGTGIPIPVTRMYCNHPVRPPLSFFGEEAHPHFFEQEEKLLELYDDDDYNYGNKNKRSNTVPSLYLFIGCNFLNIDRKSCPEHLNDIQKLCLVKLLNTKKRVIDDPMVVISASQDSQVKLEELLTRPNHLVLQDVSVDKILAQIIADCGLTEEIDKIE